MIRQADLDTLDDLLTHVRRLLQRPGYRRRFLTALGLPVAPGTLRAVRAVERLDAPEPCMSDLAGALTVDASTATRLVDQAVAEGYLARQPSSADQRRTALELTSQGRELLERANAVRRELLAEVTTGWSGEDLHALAVLLGRLTRDLDRLEQP
ncbi:MAG: MarR family transcriptional regulator [Nitriliruptorales bacterium]|nr:MarR family transcriptional regulator [Nitriliruptorales bacterium]